METCEFQDMEAWEAWKACTTPITDPYKDYVEVKFCQVDTEKTMAADIESCQADIESCPSLTDVANQLGSCLYEIAMESGSGSGDM